MKNKLISRLIFIKRLKILYRKYILKRNYINDFMYIDSKGNLHQEKVFKNTLIFGGIVEKELNEKIINSEPPFYGIAGKGKERTLADLEKIYGKEIAQKIYMLNSQKN